MTDLRWTPIEIGRKLFTNLDALQLPRGLSALENAYINEGNGHSRFPVLKEFATLGVGTTTFPYEWRGSLMVATSAGRLYRVDADGSATDVTGVPITGGRRVIFDETDVSLLMAAGGKIIQFDGTTTEILSNDAPEATHVAVIGGFAVANDILSGQFFHNETAGDFRTWTPLDVFSADRNPDNINALLANEFAELLVSGDESIEQWERGRNNVFTFRFSVAGSVFAPYTLVAADNAVWAISSAKEFIRISGQQSEPFSEDIARTLEEIDDWSDAWAAPCSIDGQDFIIVQAPNAAIPVEGGGTAGRGMTFLFDLRQRKWANLFAFSGGLRTCWPGRSYAYHKQWSRHFVGGEGGKVYELTTDFADAVATQKVVGRTAHLAAGTVCVEGLRMRVKRGVGAAGTSPTIRLRAKRDNGAWSRWVERSLGAAGETTPMLYFGSFGSGETFQFEWEVSDDVDVEIRSLEAQLQRVS